MRKTSWWIVGLSFGLAVASVACTSEEDSKATLKTYPAEWSAATGFLMKGANRKAIDARAFSLSPKVEAREGGTGHAHMPWVIGDGMSMPLEMLPQDLPTNQAWPDVVVPTTIAPGTQLQVFTAVDGKINQLVGTISVEASTRVPYSAWHNNQHSSGRCMQPCDESPCPTCNWCGVCDNLGLRCGAHRLPVNPPAGVDFTGASRAAYPTCHNDCTLCNAQNTGWNHFCWTRWWDQNCG